jgi:octaprenyl-diphosphate synthase
MSKLREITLPFTKEITEFNRQYCNKINNKVRLLHIITNYLSRTEGKKIRPLLVLLSAKLFDKINERTYTAAILIEILHNATLIHDDIVDESTLRRGKLTLHTLWPTKIAVLVGDYLLARGLQVALEKKEYEMLEKISDVVKEMSEGELLQSKTAGKKIIDMDTYMSIITKKTAKLIEACFFCGSLSTTNNPATLKKMSTIGMYAGIIFQIKDDLLDFESKNLIGKTQNNDIKNSKTNLPMLIAYHNAKKDEQKILHKKLFKKQKTKNDIRDIVSFVNANNGIKDAGNMMQEYLEKCTVLINSLPGNDTTKEEMKDLIIYFAERKN